MLRICYWRSISRKLQLSAVAVTGILLTLEATHLVAEETKPTRITWTLKKKMSREAHHLLHIRELAFSPKGEYLGLLGPSGFEVWTLPDCKEIFHVPDAKEDGNSDEQLNILTFSPDGKYLVTGGSSNRKAGRPGEISIWDICAKRKVAFRNRHDKHVTFVSFDCEGKTLLTVGGCSIRSWSIPDLKELSVVHIPNGGISIVNYNPSTKRLAGLVGRTAKVWDYPTMKEIIAFHPSDFVIPCGFALSPDGKWAASDRSIRDDHDRPICLIPLAIWNVADGTLKTSFRPSGKRGLVFVFHPSERLIAFVEHDDYVVHLGDYLTGVKVMSFDLGRRDKLDQVIRLSFSPDGKTLAVCRWERHVQLFELVKK